MPKLVRKYYTWPDLIRDTKILANKVRPFRNFDYVVAISRGGLIPAAILAYLLKIKKVQIIGYSHYQADGVTKKLNNILPLASDVKNSRVLLVDDIVDSGLTMQKALIALKKRGNKVITATIHYKGIKKPVIKPDYFVEDVGDTWPVYPWEPRTKSRRKE